jgi:hypothetical protein
MQWTIGKVAAAAACGGILAGGALVAALGHGDGASTTALRMVRPPIEAAGADTLTGAAGPTGTGLAALPPGVLPSTTTAAPVAVSTSTPGGAGGSSTSSTAAAPTTARTAPVLAPAASTTTVAAATTSTATTAPDATTTSLAPATASTAGPTTTTGPLCQPLDTSAAA